MSDPENRYELVPSTLAEGNNGGKQGGALDAYNEMLLKRITLLQDAHGGNAALKTINGQIDALRKNILQTIDRNYESTSIKLRDLKAQMGQTESRLGNIPAQERQFRDILRQQTIKEQLYIFLLQQREETSMMLANSKFKGQIIDEAYALNEPLGMGRMMMLMIAFVAGIALGVLYLYVKKLMRNKFETREELERLTSVPVLGEMCTDHSGRALVVKEGGSTSAAELFRLMRTNLQFILSGNDDKVILLTSTISGEGKSFISINLASSLALLNKRVLLVGLDIRNPKLQEYLELPPAPGFTEYIAGDRYQLKDIIRRNAVAEGYGCYYFPARCRPTPRSCSTAIRSTPLLPSCAECMTSLSLTRRRGHGQRHVLPQPRLRCHGLCDPRQLFNDERGGLLQFALPRRASQEDVYRCQRHAFP